MQRFLKGVTLVFFALFWYVLIRLLYVCGMVCMAKYKLEVKTVSKIVVLPYVFHIAVGHTVVFARFRTGRFSG